MSPEQAHRQLIATGWTGGLAGQHSMALSSRGEWWWSDKSSSAKMYYRSNGDWDLLTHRGMEMFGTFEEVWAAFIAWQLTK